ncbi:23S rRNA synthase [Aquamicrobium terrae]
MNDDDKKFSRQRGPKRFGAQARGGDKSARPASGDGKPFSKKPFAKRFGDKDAGPGQPKREFRRDERAREDRPDRPPRRDGKPGERPFRKGPPRQDRAAEGERGERRFERPKRDFESRDRTGEDRPPRSDGKPGERPFRKGPPRQDRATEGERGERRFDRPKRDFAGAGKGEGGFKPRPRPAPAAAAEEGERIAKRLARAGIASRRDAEELIAAGRIKVNGKVLTSPAFNVSTTDVIHLDGTEIPAIERTRLFLFHKPAGVVTTNRDPEGRKTVFEVLPAELPRLMTVGRLDINTEGLLLLTNDGGLARVLELPATGWLRRYRARVHGQVDEKALAGLKDGIAVDGVFYGAVEASLERTQGSNAWLTIGLREGKNREVKNILGALGLEVTRLIRISFGPFQLGELPEGHVLEIKGRMLRDQLGERLVEESGANFEADIATPFSNKPVRRSEPRLDEPARPRITRDGDHRPIGEGGLIKNRKRREGARDEALGKLSTKPERPAFGARSGKPAKDFRKGEREPRQMEPPGQRRANVWMAPGARPQGKARPDADAGVDKPRGGGAKGGPGPSGRRPRKGPPREG